MFYILQDKVYNEFLKLIKFVELWSARVVTSPNVPILNFYFLKYSNSEYSAKVQNVLDMQKENRQSEGSASNLLLNFLNLELNLLYLLNYLVLQLWCV